MEKPNRLNVALSSLKQGFASPRERQPKANDLQENLAALEAVVSGTPTILLAVYGCARPARF